MLLRVLSLELKAGQALKRPVFLRPAPAEGVLIRFAQRKSTPKRYPHGADTSPKAPNGEHGMTQESIENIVEIDDGKMFTTSQIVAQAFGKEHKNVLRDIDNLECSPEFRQLNFEHPPYVHPQNGETYPAYRLTRDGFAFLAMGFTGKKAAAWKEKFLAAFNAMEEALMASPQPRLRGRCLSSKEWQALPLTIDRMKADDKEFRAVKGLMALWAKVEEKPQEEIERVICALYSLPSLDQMADWDLAAIEWAMMLHLFRATSHMTREEASPESLHILNGLLDYCDGWRGIPRKNMESAVCKICYVDDLRHLDSIGIRKAELAVWTFMNRFSRTPDFIGYQHERKTADSDLSEKG